jgi:hypothetical protein
MSYPDRYRGPKTGETTRLSPPFFENVSYLVERKSQYTLNTGPNRFDLVSCTKEDLSNLLWIPEVFSGKETAVYAPRAYLNLVPQDIHLLRNDGKIAEGMYCHTERIPYFSPNLSPELRVVSYNHQAKWGPIKRSESYVVGLEAYITSEPIVDTSSRQLPCIYPTLTIDLSRADLSLLSFGAYYSRERLKEGLFYIELENIKQPKQGFISWEENVTEYLNQYKQALRKSDSDNFQSVKDYLKSFKNEHGFSFEDFVSGLFLYVNASWPRRRAN